MSDLKEFSMNMPMIGIEPTIGMPTADMSTSCDVTASIELPPEVNAQDVKHIYVNVDSASVTNFVGSSVLVDLVLSIGVDNSNYQQISYYKLIKRLKLDKAKLAYEAESLTPISVTEAEEDQLVVAQEMSAFYSARRACEVAGITESAGTKVFNVMFSYLDKDGKARATATMKIDYVKDKAHARHVFDAKYASKYPEAKITRVTEVV
jgi:hypothetical protein